MSEENTTKPKYTRTISIASNRPEGRVHSVTMSGKVFWVLLLLVCVIVGVFLGILFFESRQVIQITDEILTTRNEYADLKTQYDELKLTNQELSEQVQVLSDTINKRAMEDEVAAQAEAEARMPAGFPVTGSAVSTTPPEEENALEVAVYYEAGVASVVVTTGVGQVTGVRKNAYDYYEIQVDHGNGYVSIYTNSGYPLVAEGVEVLKGTPLFLIEEENTLLKYQIAKDGSLINAYDIMHIEG